MLKAIIVGNMGMLMDKRRANIDNNDFTWDKTRDIVDNMGILKDLTWGTVRSMIYCYNMGYCT